MSIKEFHKKSIKNYQKLNKEQIDDRPTDRPTQRHVESRSTRLKRKGMWRNFSPLVITIRLFRISFDACLHHLSFRLRSPFVTSHFCRAMNIIPSSTIFTPCRIKINEVSSPVHRTSFDKASGDILTDAVRIANAQ